MILNLKPMSPVSAARAARPFAGFSYFLGVLCASFFLAPLSLLFTSGAQAEVFMADIPYTDELIKLNDNYENILDTTESKRCLSYTDKDQTVCDVYEDTVLYLYKTDVTPTENVLNKNTVQVSDNLYKIYGSDAFYQDEQTNTWKQTDFGVINKGDFQAVQEDQLKNIDTILRLNNPFHVYSVNAQSPIYPGVDGWTRYLSSAAGFSTIRAGNGDVYNSTDEMYIGWNHAEDQIYRTRLTFDTSGLSDTVASSTLIIRQLGKAGTVGDIGLYGEAPANETAMSNSDYENSDEVKKSDTYTNSSAANGSSHVFLLNASGEGEIDVNGYSHFAIRARKDADATPPGDGTQDYVTFYQSETSGTASDPYLLVETEVAGPTCGDAECNGEETCVDCEEDCGACASSSTTTVSELPDLPFVDDLTVITGRTEHWETSTTSPDWYEYHYYRIPFFLWYIFYAVVSFILGILVIEIKRILKKRNGSD